MESGSPHELHGIEVQSTIELPAVRRDESRVVDATGEIRFPVKPAHTIVTLDRFGREDFDGHYTVPRRLIATINGTLTALTDLFDDLDIADGGSRLERRSCRTEIQCDFFLIPEVDRREIGRLRLLEVWIGCRKLGTVRARAGRSCSPTWASCRQKRSFLQVPVSDPSDFENLCKSRWPETPHRVRGTGLFWIIGL